MRSRAVTTRQPASAQIASPPGVAGLWPRLGELSLVVEACEFERLEADPPSAVKPTTTQIRLLGAGTDGLAEDIAPSPTSATPFPRCRWPAGGRWSASVSTSRRLSSRRRRRVAGRAAVPQPGVRRRRWISPCARPAARCTTSSNCSLGPCASSPPSASASRRRRGPRPARAVSQPALRARRRSRVDSRADDRGRRHRAGRVDRLQGPRTVTTSQTTRH